MSGKLGEDYCLETLNLFIGIRGCLVVEDIHHRRQELTRTLQSNKGVLKGDFRLADDLFDLGQVRLG